MVARSDRVGAQLLAPWHSLNFLPEPQGHGALRGVFDHSSLTTVCCLVVVAVAVVPVAEAATAPAVRASASISPSATAALAAVAKPEEVSSSDDVVTRLRTVSG